MDVVTAPVASAEAGLAAAAGAAEPADWLPEFDTVVTAAAGTLLGTETTGAEGIAAEGVDVAIFAERVIVRVGLPRLEEPDTVAAAEGVGGFGTDDDVLRGARDLAAEFEADDRVAEEAGVLLSEVSAAAVAAVMMPTAVPIPNSTANAPTRPTFDW